VDDLCPVPNPLLDRAAHDRLHDLHRASSSRGAAEQTVLQKVVPFAERGRVFGFAQSLETVASPVSTFLIGPLAQFVAIPLMTDGAGARLFGSWFRTGPDRGMALLFIAAGLIGLTITLLAFRSRGYRRLSNYYAGSDEAPAPAHRSA